MILCNIKEHSSHGWDLAPLLVTQQHRLALFWQICHCVIACATLLHNFGFWLIGIDLRWFQIVGDPPIQRFIATVFALGQGRDSWCLCHATFCSCRAFQAHVKMRVMPVKGTDFLQPLSIAGGIIAQPDFCWCGYENPIHAGIASSSL
jgi:hypothetical protein